MTLFTEKWCRTLESGKTLSSPPHIKYSPRSHAGVCWWGGGRVGNIGMWIWSQPLIIWESQKHRHPAWGDSPHGHPHNQKLGGGEGRKHEVTHLHGIPATDFQLPLQHRDHGKLRRCIRLEATTPALQSQLCGLCAELCDLAEVTETLCSHSFSLAIMREDHRLPQLYPKALCGANKEENVEGKALHKR